MEVIFINTLFLYKIIFVILNLVYVKIDMLQEEFARSLSSIWLEADSVLIVEAFSFSLSVEGYMELLLAVSSCTPHSYTKIKLSLLIFKILKLPLT